MADDKENAGSSFLKTLPGVLSAIGGLLVGVGAVVTAILALTGGDSPQRVGPTPPTSTGPLPTLGASGPTPPTATPPTTKVFSRADLVKARLTISDLPPGWVDLPEGTEIWPCNQVPVPAPAVTSGGGAFGLLSNGVAVGFAYTRLDSHATDTDATAELGSLRSNGSRCASSVFTLPGGAESFQIAPTTGPPFGDDVLHFILRQTSVVTGASNEALVTFIRWGRTLLVVEVGAPGLRTAATDSAQLDLINRAMARIQTLPK